MNKVIKTRGRELHFYQSELYDPRKNPRQMVAHQATEKYILYGGAYGGGKTAWLCNAGIYLSTKYPGNVGYMGRFELTKFKASTLLQLLKFLPPELIDNHNRSEAVIKLKNGSIIFYGGLAGDNEQTTRISNMELGWFAIDQAEEVAEMQFLLLAGRLRLPLEGIRYKGLMSANPDPGWLRDRFIENTKPDHIFIPALPKDNPFLPVDYEKGLRELYPEPMVKRLLEGNWDVSLETNYLIPYANIRRATEAELLTSGDKIAGVDVARYGDDETVFIVRQGDKVLYMESWGHEDTQYSAGRIARLIREHKPVQTHIDIVGVGAGVFDPLNNEGYAVRAINVGEAPLDKELYANRRAEYFNALAKRFEEGRIDIPDDPKLTSHLASLKYTFKNTKLQIESKETLRKRGGKSPDYADALMLAFIPIPESGDYAKIPVTIFG